jgi:hypothetical protein
MVKTSAPTQVRAPFPEHLSMTAPYNPQAAADQARATYRDGGASRQGEATSSPDQIWVNPDCGLKTRKWEEVRPALINMVHAARRNPPCRQVTESAPGKTARIARRASTSASDP